MNRCFWVMALSAASCAIFAALAIISGENTWMFLAWASFVMIVVADVIDDRLRARARRFE